MKLTEIYQPVADDMEKVQDLLTSSLRATQNPSILEMSNFLLQTPGKKTRPALVILSEKAASAGKNDHIKHDELIEIATAVELIHMASLIHDDVLDKATMRHGISSVNAKWGDDTSIALGDYIYSKAFELIGKCKNPEVFTCITEAIHAMCEGELTHICQRGNLKLSKDTYMVVIQKKTASLFAACCHVGTIIGNHSRNIQVALREFGMNFGVAFQIIDDCKDIISEEKVLGKYPGQDVVVGDMTLPLLTLLDTTAQANREELENILESRIRDNDLNQIKKMLVGSQALFQTKDAIASYIKIAKKRLEPLADSDYKRSLSQLADYIAQGTF